jgi:hypothetical protein
MPQKLALSRGPVCWVRVSCRPNARQTRPTVVPDIPLALAMLSWLQWLPPCGRSESVRSLSSATCSSPIRRGAPERGSSSSPSVRATCRPCACQCSTQPRWRCCFARRRSAARSWRAGRAPALSCGGAPSSQARLVPQYLGQGMWAHGRQSAPSSRPTLCHKLQAQDTRPSVSTGK